MAATRLRSSVFRLPIPANGNFIIEATMFVTNEVVEVWAGMKTGGNDTTVLEVLPANQPEMLISQEVLLARPLIREAHHAAGKKIIHTSNTIIAKRIQPCSSCGKK